jgi:hypothetical protein
LNGWNISAWRMTKFAHLDQRLRQIEGVQGAHTFVLHFPDGTTLSQDVKRPLELLLAVFELMSCCKTEHSFPDRTQQRFECLTDRRLRLIRTYRDLAIIRWGGGANW